MKTEIKNQWLAALRSGEYVQGKNALGLKVDDTVEYCCLGVLCDLAVQAGVIPAPEIHRNSALEYGFADERYTLPLEVRDWAELDSVDVWVRVDGVEVALPQLNDVEGLTFNELADIIEAQL